MIKRATALVWLGFFATFFAFAAKPQADGDAEAQAGRSYDNFFLEAMVERQKRNHGGAFDLLRHCVGIRPEAAEAHFYLSNYYLFLKDNARALECVKRATELSPENTYYLEVLAEIYAENKDMESAIATYERIMTADRSRADVLEVLAQLYQHTEKYDSAISALNRLEQLEGMGEGLSQAKSEIYTAQGKRKEAIEEMKRLSEQYPNDMYYKALYGNALATNGEETKAVEVLKSVVAVEPDNSRAQLSLWAYYVSEGDSAQKDSIVNVVLTNKNTATEAKVYVLRHAIAEGEQAGDSARALRFLKTALAQPQTDADIALLCAAYMTEKHLPQDTIEPVLLTLLAAAPDNVAARFHLVGYAWDKGQLDRVIDLCREARQYSPEEMAFYYYQGMAYHQKEEPDSALNAFQNGIGVINSESNPAIVSDFYAIMGDLLYEKGSHQEAFAAYDSCLQWKSDNAGCLNNYAYYLSMENRDLDKAERMSRKAIDIDKDNANNLDTYAWILFLQGRYAEAKIYIDQALSNQGDTIDVIVEHAGDIYALNGDTERAVELWTKAAKLAPDNKMLARKIKRRKYIKE